MNIDRRDFLKATGLTLSGALLSACSTNTKTLPSPLGTDGILPNGYRFYSVKYNTETLPGGGKGQLLRLDAAIDSHGRVVYGVVDTEERIGLYALNLDFSREVPRVVNQERLIRTGDILDGRKVVELNSHDINRQGHLVVVVKVETEFEVKTTDEQGNFDGGTAPMRMHSLYSDQGNGLTRVLREHITNAEGHEFAGMFGDVTIHENTMLFAANYYHNTGQGLKEVRQGVFQLIGTDGARATLVVSSGAPLEVSSSAPMISQFGLLSLHDGGQFMLQTTLTPPAELANRFTAGAAQTAVLRGNLNKLAPKSRQTGAATNLRVEASSISSGLRSSRTRGSGLSFYAPRSGANGSFAHVINNDQVHTLVVNGNVLMKTGDHTPNGRVVESIATPQLATDGLTFFMVSNKSNIELLVTNGQQTRTILKSGDKLVNHASPVSDFIGVGYTAMHSDDEGRLVFVVIHEDDSQSVVVGLPV